MQTLISAPPRTGKSLYCMSLIDQLSRKHPNRRIYTNIIGINYPGVLSIHSTVDDPFDWRDLPDGSIVFYDEAHEHPAFSAKDLLPPARTDAEKKRKEQILDIGYSLTLHGHFGFDIYLITQNPKLLNEHVRAACSVHYVMRRLWGLDVAMIYEFAEVQTYFANATRKQALSVKRFRYPKNLYKYYVSSNVHNIQKRVPLLYMVFFAIPIAIFALGYSKASDTGFFGLIPKKEQTVQTENIHPEAVEVSLSDNERDQLDKLDAESLGLTLEQYRDLKDPTKQNAQNLAHTQNSINQIVSQYKPSDPFDYSYMQAPPVTAYQVFSGCLNGTPYDTQGTILHDAPKDLCRRVMAGDRPFNPYRNVNNGMVIQDSITQDYSQAAEQTVQQVQLTPDELAKFQQAKEMGLI
ncbi:zonular occludens toxin domain-containing protein [Acinetobacter proteolyticus]|uniref:zonular occludens toxin domain-containing protein n=1 Tax=Acinetobacter proteolyticus TaxID=1776741 RepID=UPI0009D6D505|nr:zonular occludens toxin domain-containing protein [Acinetobacter proteolyticus]